MLNKFFNKIKICILAFLWVWEIPQQAKHFKISSSGILKCGKWHATCVACYPIKNGDFLCQNSDTEHKNNIGYCRH